MSEIKPVFGLPSVEQHLVFERIAPSGQKRLYKIIPTPGNRFHIVLYIDLASERHVRPYVWKDDAWTCLTFDSEEELRIRFGQEFFDLVSEAYDKKIKPIVYSALFDTLSQLPKALGELVSEEDKQHPFYILKAKLAFLDSVSRVHDKGRAVYSTITDQQLIDNKERIENDFRNTVTVNLMYFNQISVAINSALDQWGDHEMILLEFDVTNDGGRNKRRVDKACKTAVARNFVATLDEFIRLANLTLKEDRTDTITSLMASTSMVIGAMEGFKLFEQG